MKATTTPYGNFKSRKDALEYLVRYHAVEIILTYPQFAALYPYQKWLDYRVGGTNNAARHVIHNIAKQHLFGQVPGWI